MNNLTLQNKYNLYSAGMSPAYTSRNNSFDELYGNFLNQKAQITSSTKNNNPHKGDNYYQMKNVNQHRPKGHLVQGSLLPHPIRSLTHTTKTFSKALKGQGNDHDIGKINDTAIGLGAAVIATMLATAQKSAPKKAMEFVGAGAWLSSMAIWPKIFLAQPVKAMTGVDMNLEYVNAQGQQKPFFLDMQYIPWDLMDDKTLDNAGKKLNIPENIDDRDEKIHEKMKKVASGVNTWWMLTAGFSTPFMASFISNRLENPVEKLINKYKIVSAQSRLEAAGYDTGSDSVFVKMGKKIVTMFSKSDKAAKAAMDKEEKALKKLLKAGKFEPVEDFFGERFGKTDPNFVAPLLNKVESAFKKGKNEEITGMFKEATEFNKFYEVFIAKKKAVMDDTWGKLRIKTVDKHLDILGFSKKEKELIARMKDTIGLSKIIARRIKKLTKEGKIESVTEKLEKANEPVLKMVKDTEEFLTGMADGYGKKLKDGHLSGVFKKELNKMKASVVDKAINIETSLGIEPLMKLGKESVNNLSAYVRRFTDHDVHVNKSLIGGKWNEVVDKIYKKGSRIAEWLKKLDPTKEKGKVVIERLGETPPNMFHNVAEQVQGEAKWFKKLVGYSGGAVLAASAVALALIIRNAKKNDEVKKETA